MALIGMESPYLSVTKYNHLLSHIHDYQMIYPSLNTGCFYSSSLQRGRSEGDLEPRRGCQ